jgi:hypothetical protein
MMGQRGATQISGKVEIVVGMEVCIFKEGKASNYL